MERSTDGVNWSVLTSSLAANTRSYIDSGRAENTLYYYRVKPTNGDAATYSAVFSTSTIMRAPSSVNGTRVANGINLTWTINSSVSTGVAIDRSLDGLTWTNIANLATRATSYSDVISGYNANQIYYYRVRNTLGSQYSALAGWNTGLAAPTNFAVAGVTTSSVTLTWTSPLGASGAQIQQYNSSTGSWSQISPGSLQASVGTYTITGLIGGTTYTFRMRASSDADTVYSSYTSSVNATTATPSVNPVVWYKADESSGSTLADSSGNGKTATLTATYGFTTGVNGNAVNLTSGYASLPAGIVSTLGNFTIATWIKPSSIDSWSRLFDFGTSTSNYMFFTPKAGDSSLPRFAITTGSGEQRINSSVAISTNVWTHIAITLSGNTATLYINGVVAGANTSMTLWPASLGSTTQNYIGKSQYSSDPTFKGAVDDFRIYERALSASEVGTLANVAPTVAVPAAANPATVIGTTTNLSVRGADRTGESNLTYTWSATGTPPAAVTFSANGTNAAKNSIATFSKAGTYNLSVAITNGMGLTITSAVTVTVNQTLTGTNATISPAAMTVALGSSTQFNVYGMDQFGDAIATPLSNVTWSVYSGSGSINSNGLYTAPVSGSGIATIRATTTSGQILYANATLLNEALWYRFDDGSGTTAADSSGNSRAGTLVNGPTWTTGGFIGGLTLNGTSQYVTVPALNLNSNAVTMTGWVKRNGAQSDYTGITFYRNGNGTASGISMRSTGQLAYHWNDTGWSWSSGLTVPDGVWTFVALVITPSNATMYMQPAGAAMQSAVNTASHAAQAFSGVAYIGQDSLGGRFFKGSLDDFRIINRSLSVAEIRQFTTPTVITAANASTVNSTSAVLSVLGADTTGGESSLTYTWSTTGTLPAPVVFSVNGFNSAKNTTATFTKVGTYNFLVTVTNAAGLSTTSSLSVTINSTIAGRNIFYNGSQFDSISDDNSIATDTQALLPGGTATFANYTSYSRGINGIMVDIQSLANPGALSASDFQFKVGNDNTPSAWTMAPAPLSVTVRTGAGTGGSDRVTITWADNAIQNQWLQVTVLANANTGLGSANVFYFGNAVGESGNNTGSAVVDAQDESLALANKSGFSSAPITNSYDYNRDGRVTVADVLVARHNHTDGGGALQLISAPLSGGLLAAQATLQPIMLTVGSVSSDIISSPSSDARTQFPDTPRLQVSQVLEPIELNPPRVAPAIEPVNLITLFSSSNLGASMVSLVLEPVVSNLKSLQQSITISSTSSRQDISQGTRLALNENLLHDTIFSHSTVRHSRANVDTLNDLASRAEVEILLESHMTCISDKSFHRIIDTIFSTTQGGE